MLEIFQYSFYKLLYFFYTDGWDGILHIFTLLSNTFRWTTNISRVAIQNKVSCHRSAWEFQPWFVIDLFGLLPLRKQRLSKRQSAVHKILCLEKKMISLIYRNPKRWPSQVFLKNNALISRAMSSIRGSHYCVDFLINFNLFLRPFRSPYQAVSFEQVS